MLITSIDNVCYPVHFYTRTESALSYQSKRNCTGDASPGAELAAHAARRAAARAARAARADPAHARAVRAAAAADR